MNQQDEEFKDYLKASQHIKKEWEKPMSHIPYDPNTRWVVKVKGKAYYFFTLKGARAFNENELGGKGEIMSIIFKS
jgi:YHS domain-containing protein